MRILRATLALFGASLRRQLASRRLLFSFVLVALVSLAIRAFGGRRPFDYLLFCRIVDLRIFGLFLLPAIAVAFGAAVVGDERDERTLVYSLSRPIPRSLSYLARLAAAAPFALALSVGGLSLLVFAAASGSSLDIALALSTLLPAAAFATLAYLAFFALLGVVFRHGVLVGAAYAFFVEVFVGRLPGVVKRVSISFYHASAVYDAGEAERLEPFKRSVFLPVDGETAVATLVVIALACAALGAIDFAAREERETI
jgi:ABC-type transport system involved in multi-copper enzyme maturation permease subunit